MFLTISLALIFVISITLHEYAHAWASDKLGDPTPKLQWRLTPNPLVHIDLIGFLMIFLINFGRWRAVIINPSYYKNRRRDELLVALAGPFTNFLLACGGILIAQLYISVGNISVLDLNEDLIFSFRRLFSWINVSLGIFNLLPLPPLDGYRIISYLVPGVTELVDRYGYYISIAVLLILVTPNPVRESISTLISTVSQFLFGLLRAFWWIIFL